MRNGKTIFDLPLRVTFYARVSTDKDEQRGSLENQVQYYTELIQSKPNWTYIEGYVDEGISGTRASERSFWMRASGSCIRTHPFPPSCRRNCGIGPTLFISGAAGR